MRLYKIEVFKLFYRKFFMICLLSVLGILLLYFYFVNVGDERTTVNGNLYTGYKAVQVDREITKEFSGVLTDDIAEQIVEKYGFPSKVEEYYGYFRDQNYLNGFITKYLGNGYFRDWNDYQVSTSLYTISQTDLGRVVEVSGNKITLDYTKGWTVFFDTLQLGMILGSVLILVGVSPVFSEEYQNKMAALLFTSEEGKSKDIIAKIAASFTMTNIIYIVIVSCVFGCIGSVYGFTGKDCIIGTVLGNALNPANPATMKTVSFFAALTLILDYLALLSLCAITVCVSAHFKSLFHAVSVSCMIWLAPLLIRIMGGGAGYILMSGTPLFMIMSGVLIDSFNFLLIPIIIAMCILILCTINGWHIYRIEDEGGENQIG